MNDQCEVCSGEGELGDPDLPSAIVECWHCGGTRLSMPTQDDLTPFIERIVAPFLHGAVRRVIWSQIIADRKRHGR